MATCDVAIVGAGIVGLAHALAAARRGLRVEVFERDARASHASVRNFGFVTVSGQADGATRARALRSRAVWEEAAAEAGIPILQRGALVVARRPEALAVLEQFARTPMGERCELWDARRTLAALPAGSNAAGALWSPHELRVEAREAIPRLAAWLATRGVEFRWGEDGTHAQAPAVIFAPGAEAGALFPERARRVKWRMCTLQMMRIAAPAWRLPGVVMSDLSLVRYEGFAAQPASAGLRARLGRERPEHLARGIHLIVAQGADGSLVVGDSHAYGESAEPFARADVEALILGDLRDLFGDTPEVIERWVGHYPVAEAQPVWREPLGERKRLVVVTGGTGMSTAFAIGEETLTELFGTP
jgi:FAD dependent oxidoreductase TIGR03364